jgi:hypothetical protein
MYNLCYDITIGSYRFDKVVSVRVNSSWKTLGDTATIVLPGLKGLLARKTKQGNGIRHGDAVVIKLGYNGILTTEFTGFVKLVRPNIPMVIECEDYLYKLRSKMLENKYCPSLTTALNLVKEAVPEIVIDRDVLDINLGFLRLDYSAATLLQKFQRDFNFACYFRGNVLYVGLAPYLKTTGQKKVNFYIRYSAPGNVINTDLIYYHYDQVKIRILAIGVKRKGNKNYRIEANVGDADGELRHVVYWDIDNRKELIELAKWDLASVKFEGYQGTITAFGWPNVRHSDIVYFKDELFPERAGEYFVDEVITSSGRDGFRREIRLGEKQQPIN